MFNILQVYQVSLPSTLLDKYLPSQLTYQSHVPRDILTSFVQNTPLLGAGDSGLGTLLMRGHHIISLCRLLGGQD